MCEWLAIELGARLVGLIGLTDASVSAPETWLIPDAASPRSTSRPPDADVLALGARWLRVLMLFARTSRSCTPSSSSSSSDRASGLAGFDAGEARAPASFGRDFAPDRKRLIERNSRRWVPSPRGFGDGFPADTGLGAVVAIQVRTSGGLDARRRRCRVK